MRFEVPQFIEIEDKIIGPLTWKQFVYVAGGVGILVILYLLNLPFLIFIVLGIPFAILSASLAFHRVNNRPFSAFLESFLNYASRGKLYLWRKSEAQSVIEKSDSPKSESGTNLSFTGKRSIAVLSRKLDLQPNHTDHG